jgi:hypothetical protein
MTNPPVPRNLEFLPNTCFPAQAILNLSIPLFVGILPLLVLPAVPTALKEGTWMSAETPVLGALISPLPLHKLSIACSDHRSARHPLQGLLPDSPSGRAPRPTSFSAHERLAYALECPSGHRPPLAQRS